MLNGIAKFCRSATSNFKFPIQVIVCSVWKCSHHYKSGAPLQNFIFPPQKWRFIPTYTPLSPQLWERWLQFSGRALVSYMESMTFPLRHTKGKKKDFYPSDHTISIWWFNWNISTQAQKTTKHISSCLLLYFNDSWRLKEPKERFRSSIFHLITAWVAQGGLPEALSALPGRLHRKPKPEY